jgi:hypothetical protein
MRIKAPFIVMRSYYPETRNRYANYQYWLCGWGIKYLGWEPGYQWAWTRQQRIGSHYGAHV